MGRADVRDAEALTLLDQDVLAEKADPVLAPATLRDSAAVIALVIANLDYGEREPWFEPLRSACAEFGIPIMGVLGETVTDASLFVHILRMPADADEFVRATLQVLSKLKKWMPGAWSVSNDQTES